MRGMISGKHGPFAETVGVKVRLVAIDHVAHKRRMAVHEYLVCGDAC
jgi:hypothetical protein